MKNAFQLNRNINIEQIFSSSEELKRMIASLIHAGARIDRDENHVRNQFDYSFLQGIFRLSLVAICFLREIITSSVDSDKQSNSIDVQYESTVSE